MTNLSPQQKITSEQLRALMKCQQAPFLLDVREVSEHAKMHIEGCSLIPLKQLPDRIDELPKDRAIVVYCHSGMRSADATTYLSSCGFSDVKNLIGGIVEWSKSNPA